MAFTPRTWVVGETVTAALMNQEVRDGFTATYQETMAWTPLSSLGSFATNFSAGTRVPRMHKFRLGGIEVWEFDGTINTSSFPANADHTMFTLTAGHRVASERVFPTGAAQSGRYAVRLSFTSAGLIVGSVPTAAGGTTSIIWLDGVSITEPLRT
jgi:predicted pyridoxine 5'-phosphate oxidase superfamily flavin-nucleotide-binding protein